MENALSIFIPTYNRKHKLIPLLNYLNLKIPANVSINIINNLSTDGTKEAILDLSDNLNYKINYFENNTNIGGNANIIRCLEYCTTEWLWILGDDDTPEENAIQIILDKINLHPQAIFINFQTTLSFRSGDKPEATDIVAKGQAGLINNMKSFPNVLFISASIYNTTELKKNLKTAYYFCYSCAPQTAVLLDYLADNPSREVVYAINFICNWEPPSIQDKWNDNAVNASLTDILFVVTDKENRKTLFDKINLYHPYSGLSFNKIISSLVFKSNSHKDLLINCLSSSSFNTWLYDRKAASKESFKSIWVQIFIIFSKYKWFRILLNRMVKISLDNKVIIYNRFEAFKRDKRG